MIGHSAARLFFFCTSLIWISIDASQSVGQDSLRSLLKCRQSDNIESGPSQRVLLRSFPFADFDSIEVPSQGTALISILAKRELLSVAIQQIRFPKTQDKEVRNRFFAGITTSPSMFCAIVHIRGNEVTIFPRVMLVHPLIALAAVKPNDVVITIELKPESLQKSPEDLVALKSVQELNEADPIHRWFYESFANVSERKAVRIRLSGDVLPSTIRGIRTIEPEPGSETASMTLGLVIGDRLTNSLDLKNIVEASAIGDDLVVSIVRRQVGPYILRYVVPLQHAGAFRIESSYYQKTFEKESTGWNPRLSSFLRFPLVDGDTLEVTSSRSVPLFQKQGQLVPVN